MTKACKLHASKRVQVHPFAISTPKAAYRCWELIVHISVLPGTHLHLGEVKHATMTRFSYVHNVENQRCLKGYYCEYI